MNAKKFLSIVVNSGNVCEAVSIKIRGIFERKVREMQKIQIIIENVYVFTLAKIVEISVKTHLNNNYKPKLKLV